MAQDHGFTNFHGNNHYQYPSQPNIDQGSEPAGSVTGSTTIDHAAVPLKAPIQGDLLFQSLAKPEDSSLAVFNQLRQFPARQDVETIIKPEQPAAAYPQPRYDPSLQESFRHNSSQASPMLLYLKQLHALQFPRHPHELQQYLLLLQPPQQYPIVPLHHTHDTHDARPAEEQRNYPVVYNPELPAGAPYGQYSDMTSMVNSNANIVVAPMVETTFVDYKVCRICNRRITRDMTRHRRTHQLEKRFSCMFPKDACRHKLGQFNRPYDFKKHLLNKHFIFDDPSVKKLQNLRDKLDWWGTCLCGKRFLSLDWLHNHILTDNEAHKCAQMER